MPGFTRSPWFLIGAGLIIVVSTTALYYTSHQRALYTLSTSEQSLLSDVTVSRELISETKDSYTYNHADEQKDKMANYVLASPEDSTGKVPYTATLPKDPSKGITFSDSEDKYTLTMTPKFDINAGVMDDGHIIYPSSTTERHSYTFKRNGIKQDIILTKSPNQGSKSFAWELSSGDLEAKAMPDGSIGLYSANPLLYGEISVGDDKSQKLLDNAKKNGEKTNLAFVLPKPFITDSKGNISYDNVSYKLAGKILTLEAKGLNDIPKANYPISIDPTVVVTTTADFKTSTGNDGMIDYGTSGQINSSNIYSGAAGTTTQQLTAFTTPRSLHSRAVYNGYLYIIGGQAANSATGCNASGYCNDIQYCPIDASTGAIGACTQQLTAFTTPRYSHTSVVYNGYLYIIGGGAASSATGCNVSGLCNDIQYCPINANGSIGTCTQQLTAFTTPRYSHTSTAYNGYLYISGGGATGGSTGCNASGYCNDIQYCPLNANGSVGTCTQQLTAFTTPRYNHTSAIYNGYLYIIGGSAVASATGCDANGNCNDIQYCPINANGSIGTCTQQLTAFTTPRSGHTSVVYNGYLYIIGGTAASATGCNVSGYCGDIQYCPINASGTVGACTQQLSAFTTFRFSHTSVVYNGYLYIIGGFTTASATGCDVNGRCNDIQRLPISQGRAGPTTQQLTAFTTGRFQHATAVYNGYLYISGGTGIASATGCNATGYCNDIHYCPINASGVIGACTQQLAAFTTPRTGHTFVASNGYLYIIGGTALASATGCNAAGFCNDIQYCPINANGTTGACTQQLTAFTTPRYTHSSVVANGYLYIIGGYSGSGTYQNDIQYCPINASTGAVSACTQQLTAFTSARAAHTSVISNGYLYIIGGNAGGNMTGCPSGGLCSDIQYCLLDAATGAVGTCTQQLTAFTSARDQHTSVISNGYLYIIGGTTPSNQNDIQYCPIDASTGAVGTCTQQLSAFTSARYASASVAYNGYLYIIGGFASSGATGCPVSATCSDIQRLLIGPHYDGQGTNTQQLTAFTTFRSNHTSVAYNGYLYIIGGLAAASATGCDAAGRCNDVQRCPISASTGALSACTTQLTAFTTPRWGHTSVINNGYLYIIGGNAANSATGCDAAGRCNDVQRCPISASTGALSACTTQLTAFTTPRYQHASAVYNGYLYITGGSSANSATGCNAVGRCNDVQRCPISASTGALSACTTQLTAFTTPRISHTSAAYNGYLYIIGGIAAASATGCNASGYCGDIQYCPINAGTGALSACTTQLTAFTTPRYAHASAVYNGHLYIHGGYSGSFQSDIQYCPINAGGSVAACTQQLTAFTTARSDHAAVAYNGYMYTSGGSTPATSPTGCDAAGRCGDIQYSAIKINAYSARYERTIDIGVVTTNLNNLTINGTAVCGGRLEYATAGSNGIYSAITNVPIYVGQTVPITTASARYLRLAVTLDDSACGGISSITDITLGYIIPVPEAPTLITLTNAATNQPNIPAFTFRTTDPDSSYVQYKLELCSTSDCSSLVSGYPAAQASSQTGWSGQDSQTNTAYVVSTVIGSSTIATYTHPGTSLTPLTTYYWRVAAIDPGGVNLYGDWSAIRSFTPGNTPAIPTLTQPTTGQTTISLTPEFRLYSTDSDGDYLRYKIEVCSTSNCSAIVSTIDQTSSQVGWRAQSTPPGTGYTSGQIAIYAYQLASLNPSTQYWWRGYTTDSVNGWGTASSIFTFTTGVALPNQINIGGGTTIYGGVTIGGN